MLPIGKVKPTIFDTDSADTKDQAEALLKEYYKSHRTEFGTKRYKLDSWKFHENGTMIVVDGTSGRKLEFVTNQDEQAREQAEILAEDAEAAALDAEAEADAARAQVKTAEEKAKAAETQAKASKASSPKGATNAANEAHKTNEQYKAELKAKEDAAKKVAGK